MDEPRALRSALTRAGVTQDIEVKAFVGQGFASVGDLEIINTLSQLLLTFKYICSGVSLHPGNIPFSITAAVSIKAFWFWINDRRRRNQYQTGVEFNQDQRDEFHEIYRYVQECADANHDNEWILPKWESNTTLSEWDDFLLNVMENKKFLSDKHTPIKYLLRKQEATTATDDLPAGLSRLEVW